MPLFGRLRRDTRPTRMTLWVPPIISLALELTPQYTFLKNLPTLVMLLKRLPRPNVKCLQGPSVQRTTYVCPSCLRASVRFSTSAKRNDRANGPFRTRLRSALRDTKIQWKPIPVGLGIAFLGAVQFYRVREREKGRQQEEDESIEDSGGGGQSKGRPRKRKRIRPSGPW